MMPAPLHGNLTSDPEGREVGTSTVARFTVAVDDGYRDRQGEWKKNPTLFANVEAWGSTARGVLAELKAGSPVVVVGQWRAAEYEKDGEKRRRQYVVADAVGKSIYAAKPKKEDTASESDEGGAAATEETAPTEGGDGEGDFWGGAK